MRFSVGAGLFKIFIWGLVVVAAGMWLQHVKNGPPQRVTLQNCATRSVLVGSQGVPCTVTRQNHGWPIVANTVFTDAKPLESGTYVPKHFYECYNGCGRYSPSVHIALVASVVVAGHALLWLWAKYKLRKELRTWEGYSTKSL